jgi:hypothetical protein
MPSGQQPPQPLRTYSPTQSDQLSRRTARLAAGPHCLTLAGFADRSFAAVVVVGQPGFVLIQLELVVRLLAATLDVADHPVHGSGHCAGRRRP